MQWCGPMNVSMRPSKSRRSSVERHAPSIGRPFHISVVDLSLDCSLAGTPSSCLHKRGPPKGHGMGILFAMLLLRLATKDLGGKESTTEVANTYRSRRCSSTGILGLLAAVGPFLHRVVLGEVVLEYWTGLDSISRWFCLREEMLGFSLLFTAVLSLTSVSSSNAHGNWEPLETEYDRTRTRRDE